MTNVELVQLLIGDTAAELFTVAQIQAFLDLSAIGGTENVYAAASVSCRSLAASATLLHKAERIGNYSIDRKSMADAYRNMAAEFDKMVTDPPVPTAIGVIQFAHTNAIAQRIVVNDAMRN
ncbi:MAG: hypothetical protein JRG73_16455 [Deltaproteobacteria bacterium]|nr:hypothetical protein [Deltaproteobacteria bacterium]